MSAAKYHKAGGARRGLEDEFSIGKFDPLCILTAESAPDEIRQFCGRERDAGCDLISERRLMGNDRNLFGHRTTSRDDRRDDAVTTIIPQ